MANNTEKRITAKMVLDSTGYNDKLKGLNAEMKKHQSELKLASEGIKSFGKDSEKLRNVQEALTKQIELHSKKVDLYKQSIEKTNAKMQDNIKTRDKLRDSLDRANKKYEETVKIYGKESDEAKKAKDEVDRLKQEHEKSCKAVESNAKQVQGYETNLNKAKEQMVKTQGELKKVSSELDKSNNKWLGASEKLKTASEGMKNVGSGMDKAGDKILKITAPLAAGGIASLKFSNEFEDSIAKVSTISEEAEVPIADLRKGILKLSSDTGIAASEIANNTYDAISAGQKTGDAVNFVANSTKLAKAGFAEASDSLDVLTTIMNSYKMKSEEVTNVSDILIQVQNKGKVTVGELSSVMGKVIPTAVATNTNLKQVGAGYALMTANGIKAAETTTYMNSMLNELSKTGTDADKALRAVSGKSFEQLMKEGKNLSDVLTMLDGHAKKNKLSLKDMFGSAEAGKAALVLATNAGADFNGMLKDMESSAGATDAAFEKVTNTRGEKFKKALNKARNEAIRFGDAIAPMMDKASELLGKVTDKLSSLSTEQLQSIAKWEMFAIATGGALKVLGGGISTLGNIAGGLSKLTGFLGKAKVATEGASVATGVATKGISAMGLATKAATFLTNPWVLGIVAASAAGYGLYKVLNKQCIPAQKLFGSETSESTKKAVGAYMELDKKAGQSLMNLKINGSKVSKETAKEITKNFNDMSMQVKSSIEKKCNESYGSMQTFFNKSSALTEEEEKKILENMNKQKKMELNIIDTGNKKIAEIMKKASDENRKLSAEEEFQISTIKQNMKESAVKHMSETELEEKAILQRMKDQAGNLTAQQAAEVVKNSATQRDKAIKNAEEQYDQTVKEIIRQRDETGAITADQAQKLIESARCQKDEAINCAKGMHEEVVMQAKQQAEEHVDKIDWETGQIKTYWQELKGWFADNPITRWIKTQSDGVEYQGEARDMTMNRHWTGTNFFTGGLTYLHDQPGNSTNYELYDLPKGTRIFNHDASADLVMKTAEDVATKVAQGVLKNFKSTNGVNVTNNFYGKVESPYEVAKATKRSMRDLSFA